MQATAFNEAFDPEDYVDTTVPNYEMIHKRAGEPMKEWKEMLEEDPEANIIIAPVKKTAVTGTKRKAVSKAFFICFLQGRAFFTQTNSHRPRILAG